MSDELAFDALLAKYNEAYAAAEEFGDDWMPDDIEGLIVTISEVKTGSYKKDDDVHPFWRVIGRIDSPDHDDVGREFCLQFLSTQMPGMVKTFAKKFNNGVSVNDLGQANSLILGSVGTTLSIDVKTKADKKGIDRTNCYIKDILEVQENKAGPEK